ncbi:hypothetical protein HPB51_002966 [Rhipicephalus microplus]|uniref:Uncharacterized protein n=1 Tax=Rhipicephalus microplus TaxID=6941 RepID=A0A9J6DSW6_RHIMP|nr:hypothetical protein HPB51_002966 [Rhipicephalus microplus]
MAFNAATDQQYHLLDQDGTADDQMDQLQGDHDTGSRCLCLRRKWRRYSERGDSRRTDGPLNRNLMVHLRVRTHGVESITARMIGTTKSAAITFFSPTLPRTVYYYGGELRCYPFRPTLQVCKVCREKDTARTFARIRIAPFAGCAD